MLLGVVILPQIPAGSGTVPGTVPGTSRELIADTSRLFFGGDAGFGGDAVPVADFGAPEMTYLWVSSWALKIEPPRAKVNFASSRCISILMTRRDVFQCCCELRIKFAFVCGFLFTCPRVTLTDVIANIEIRRRRESIDTQRKSSRS